MTKCIVCGNKNTKRVIEMGFHQVATTFPRLEPRSASSHKRKNLLAKKSRIALDTVCHFVQRVMRMGMICNQGISAGCRLSEPRRKRLGNQTIPQMENKVGIKLYF